MSAINSIDETRFQLLSAAGTHALLSGGEPHWPSRILVCAHDSPSTGDALSAAKALGSRSGATVGVLTVFAPRIPLPNVPSQHGVSRCEEQDRRAAAELIDAVRSEARQRFDGDAPWPVHLEVGDPVKLIIESARQTNADLVVVGLGSRDPSVRRERIAVPVSVSRYTEVPLLAAAPVPTLLPQTAVLFVDRESPDRALIRAALRCTEDVAVVWALIYSGSTAHSGNGVPHDKNALREILKAIRREASAVSKGIVVRAVYRAGDPVDAVLSLAREVNADLIVTPVHGAAGTIRSLVPNITDRLLLNAACSVLVVPTGSG